MDDVNERMRSDWNQRAREDAHFYAGFGRHQQSEDEFMASAAETVPAFEQELVRLPEQSIENRRALEIGCGPGRLMLPLSRHFGEIHGADISEEMIALARNRLRDVPGARFHLTTGSDLGMLADDYFDFIYSYTVFQHIPSRAVVLNYFEESRRVLKPGGIFCAQIRGSKPIESELEREPETWTGCYFTADDMAAFARENRFSLVALSGLDTQYMWVTFRKPQPETLTRDFAGVNLKAVTSASGPETQIPDRGRQAALSLWIDGMPANAGLENSLVRIGGRPQLGCYLSPITESGGCQLNVRLPVGVATGKATVQLEHDGNAIGQAHEIEVVAAPPFEPRIVSVTDGINLTSRFRIETGGVKVTIEDVAAPRQVTFTVDGKPSEYLQFECRDPITSTYEFAFRLAQSVRRGRRVMVARIADRELDPVVVDVA